MVDVKEIASNKCFGGIQKIFSHQSEVLGCRMNFGVFLPPNSAAENPKQSPVLYWLSGLTCTETNFVQKAGFQRYAAAHNLIVVNPDTSPRGCNIEGEDDSYDFGSGAGFYVDATEKKWAAHYRMYTYVTNELPKLVESNFPVIPGKRSIFGHSMGGHGALISSLKNPGMFCSVSAFAPICNPINCPWGQKAFSGYLGEDRSTWEAYDATELIKKYSGSPLNILIDQGDADEFYICAQLLPDNFLRAAQDSGVPVKYRLQKGYDHSYFFMSTFMEDHVKHHAQFLNA